MESRQEVLEKFSNPELVPHQFLDSKLPSHNSNEPLDGLHSEASTLLSQLDHHSQELTLQLNTLTSDLERASKKVSYEVELLRTDVASLLGDVDKVGKDKVAKLAATDTTTVERLKRMDIVKSRMNQVQQIFTQAKEFDEGKITEKVVSLAQQGDESAATQQIDKTAELCQVWKGTGVYQQRLKFIADLRKQVERIISEQQRRTSSQDKRESSKSRTSTPQPPSRSDTPQPEESSYGGFFGQFTRRMGY